MKVFVATSVYTWRASGGISRTATGGRMGWAAIPARERDLAMALGFEWDERKRQSNLDKHGIDFLDVGQPFSGPHLRSEVRTVAGERRHALIGLIDDLPVTVIFAHRNDAVRVISIRRARRGERRRYEEVFGRGA